MTNPTTYFGWQMPTATDLVTDLPADFEVFGQAVDTDFQDLLGGTTGQVLSKTSGTDLDFTWINNDQGDITAVTAGTGISGGGTSGAVTITNSMATEITAKADLIVGTGNAAFDNLAVGTNGQVLTADSTVSPTGLKWATPSATTPAFVGCSLKFGAGQSLSNATELKVAFDQEYFDTNTFHDNTTNNSRITIPASYAGKYLVMANIAITAWNNDTRVSIFKNGSAVAATFLRWNAPDLVSANIFYILDCAVSDYLQINMFQSSGSTQTIKGQNDLGASSSFFQVQFLGA